MQIISVRFHRSVIDYILKPDILMMFYSGYIEIR